MPENRRKLGSDLARVDAHVIQPHEYDELPELTDAELARGVEHRGGIAVNGSTSIDVSKSEITLLLDTDLIEYFQAMGSSWRSNINDILREATKLKVR